MADAPSTPDIVQDLNKLYAEEVEASLRYLHLMAAVRGLDRMMVEPILRQAFDETIDHARTIAQKLRTLGAAPELKVDLHLAPERVSGREALEIALTFEEAALEAYQDMLRRCQGDVVLEEFIRQQIAAEAQHVAELKDYLA